MTNDTDLRINLNPPARRPAPDAPWRDDALQRQGIASRLDALVNDLADGAQAATIALDGGYGTGKTFILERWVQEMHDRGQIAVYYNAWENDGDDDPLVSLIETLTSNNQTDWDKRLTALNEALAGILDKYVDVNAQKSVRAFVKRAEPASRGLGAALTGLLRKCTGISAKKVREAVEDKPSGLLGSARHRRESRQRLKKLLSELIDETRANGVSGVVVVIDELDRCRPTFANEMMERVKHVLNVPGLVFVFGVNIDALRETVKSVYGEIDAHKYLLRMFTTKMHMPPTVSFPIFTSSPIDPHEYLKGLANRHGLLEFCRRHQTLGEDLDGAIFSLAIVASGGGFTPLELENVMWLLGKFASWSLSSSVRPSGEMLRLVLLPLAIARVKDPEAYYQTVSRPDEATAVLNCVFGLIQLTDFYASDPSIFDTTEMAMYQICHLPSSRDVLVPPAYEALRRRAEGLEMGHYSQFLSLRLAHVTTERAKVLLDAAPKGESFERTDEETIRGLWNFGTLQLITSGFDVIWSGAPSLDP